MSFPTAALIACVVTVVLGFLATQPEELREHRWLKIFVSLVPVLMITWAATDLNAANAYFAMFSFGILALIWKSPIAHAGSYAFMRLLHGDMHRPTSGIRAEFGAAKALHKHGDLEDALRQTKAELEKDPFNYEGLLLLAQIHIDLDEPGKALDALDLILKKTPLTDRQREVVLASREDVEQTTVAAR